MSLGVLDRIRYACMLHTELNAALYEDAKPSLAFLRLSHGIDAQYDHELDVIYVDPWKGSDEAHFHDALLHEHAHAGDYDNHGRYFKGYLEQLRGMFHLEISGEEEDEEVADEDKSAKPGQPYRLRGT